MTHCADCGTPVDSGHCAACGRVSWWTDAPAAAPIPEAPPFQPVQPVQPVVPHRAARPRRGGFIADLDSMATGRQPPGVIEPTDEALLSGGLLTHRRPPDDPPAHPADRPSPADTSAPRRGRRWSDLVWLPTVRYRVPTVMADPTVPERLRNCGGCGAPVGRTGNGTGGRADGYCTVCGTAFSFAPALRPGEVVAGQYEIQGCLTRGGLGWIYLAHDRNLDGRPVVLKGLLNTGDADAQEAAISERRFMIEIEHPGVVRILNFVRHPDPRTGVPAGYIVMEYVGGLSLDVVPPVGAAPSLPDLLPLPQALAYGVDALGILGDLHEQGVLFCDFKDSNVMQVGDQLRLLDLGGARRIGDAIHSVVWGTRGYEAPEVPVTGPSVASDLYTVGRTLARLTLDCPAFQTVQGFTTTYQHRLPAPEDAPVLAGQESYRRFLRRATHRDPAHRFTSAAEMADQLRGVLREVLATEDGVPRPGPSRWFTPERRVAEYVVPTGPHLGLLAAAAVPVPQVDAADPGAPFLAALGTTEARRLLAALDAVPVESAEIGFRRVRAHLETGDPARAAAELAAVERTQPKDWRTGWYRALVDLAAGRPEVARRALDDVYDRLPGEPAVRLALGFAAECCGDLAAAGTLYETVWRTDHAWVNAAFGLARTRLGRGDRAGAVAALRSIPPTSSSHVAARVAAVRVLLTTAPGTAMTAEELTTAAADLDVLHPGDERREQLALDLLHAALDWVRAGCPGASPGQPRPRILGHKATENALRRALERAYRDLARRAPTLRARMELIAQANQVRPWTWL